LSYSLSYQIYSLVDDQKIVQEQQECFKEYFELI